MGKLLYDTTCQELINNQDETLSEASKLLLKDAQFIAEHTDDNILVGIDLNDMRYHDDISIMTISDVDEDNMYILYCVNETKYI